MTKHCIPGVTFIASPFTSRAFVTVVFVVVVVTVIDDVTVPFDAAPFSKVVVLTAAAGKVTLTGTNVPFASI